MYIMLFVIVSMPAALVFHMGHTLRIRLLHLRYHYDQTPWVL
ncbi:hypothetical protein [Halomonas sp. SpR8]|nr:hypothetical protein [Halomonas sp. SpR8]MDQ7730677.1 hypothetical protein [Halomonas sp. SpR8]